MPTIKIAAMKRILVPVDFSPTSAKALRFAAYIAAKAGGSIVIYHLITPETSRTIGVYHDVARINEQKESDSLKRLQRLSKKVGREFPQISVSAVIDRKPVVANILKFAGQNQADLIVMGTQGASGLQKIAVGSVAARVLSRSAIPVLLIPEKYVSAPVGDIVFTTSFDDTDRDAFPFLFELAGHLDATVTLVNLINPNAKSKEDTRKNIEAYGYVLQRAYNDAKMQFKQLSTTSITETLENLHKKVPYDLLVMARRKQGPGNRIFKQRFTKKMAYVTKLPLLIIPEKA